MAFSFQQTASMVTNPHQYINNVKSFIAKCQGNELANNLTFKGNHAKVLRMPCELRDEQISSVVGRSPWSEIVSSHLKVLTHIHHENYTEAFKEQMNSTVAFTRYFKTLSEENWPLPVLYVLSRDLRLLSIAADKEHSLKRTSVASHKDPNENLSKASEAMMNLYRVCSTDIRSPLERSKKHGMVILTNQLFKIYFKINKLNLCKPLIRALSQNNELLSASRRSEQVTYNYFIGRKALFDSGFKEAESLLTSAFTNCDPQCFKNKRLILLYLVPAKMLLGQMPKESALVKYQLNSFMPLVKSIREGNIKAFDAALDQEKDFFWTYGIYLLLEKLRTILYRNIFKKVSLILGLYQIPIKAFKIAIDLTGGEEVDIQEIHCILANLIYENKIKGYISMQHQKLVISKQNPFPSLASVAIN